MRTQHQGRLLAAWISGIREVLTPEAWLRQGSRYKLTHPSREPARERSLGYLRSALLDYARSHEGRYPPHDFGPELHEKLWEAPDEMGTHYLYVGGLTTNDTGFPLAIEPPEFGDPRWVLTAEGGLEKLSEKEIVSRWKLPPTP